MSAQVCWADPSMPPSPQRSPSAGLGRLKRKKPHLVEKGIMPVRTPEKNVRHLWKLDVIQEEDAPWPPAFGASSSSSEGSGGGGGSLWAGSGSGGHVRIEVAGNGFLYRWVRVVEFVAACLRPYRLSVKGASYMQQKNSGGQVFSLSFAQEAAAVWEVKKGYLGNGAAVVGLHGRRGRPGGGLAHCPGYSTRLGTRRSFAPFNRMVRMLVASLVEVGHGRLSPGQIGQILESGDRGRLPEAAPPHGLYLMRVMYDLPEGVQPLPRSRRDGGPSSGTEDEEGGDGDE